MITNFNSIGISFLDTDYTDGHGSGLDCLNNGIIVQTMLPFHKCSRIYEIKGSVTRLPNLVGQVSEIRVRDFLSSPERR